MQSPRTPVSPRNPVSGSPPSAMLSPSRTPTRAPASGSPSATPGAKSIQTAETGFGITKDGLAEIVLEKDINLLARYGGVKGVVRKLRADPDRGLRSDLVAHHRSVFGENRFPPRAMRSFLRHFFDSLNDVVLISLLIAAAVTIGFGVAGSGRVSDTLLGVGILIAVAIVSLVNSVQAWRQERQTRVLADIKADRAVTLLRDGNEQRVSVHDVVVGDILVVRAGDVLPVDGLFLTGNGIKCDESDITGETFFVAKGPDSLFLVGGARIMGGACTMLVLTTGMDTTYGQLVKTLEDMETPPTHLEDKLELLATRIGYGGLAAGVSVFLVLILTYLVRAYPLYSDAFIAILSFFIMGVTVIIVAVPEGLPLALTLTIVNAMRNMLAERIHVKDASTCDEMGTTTAIVTSKSGALTQSVLTTARGWVFGVMHDDIPDLTKLGGSQRRDLLARCIANNTDAQLRYTPEALRAFAAARAPALTAAGTTREAVDAAATSALAAAEMIGSRTEVALLHMLRLQYDIDYSYVRRAAGPFVYRENFSPSRARMTTIYAPASPGGSNAPFPTVAEGGVGELAGVPTGFPGCGRYTVYTKGAPEAIIALCAHYLAADGSLVPLEARRRETVLAMVDLIASRGLRPIAIATRTIDPPSAPIGHDAPGEPGQRAWANAIESGGVENGMALVAVFGLRDLLRPGLADVVARCRGGGIKVRLATGDHAITAKTVATEAGIYTSGVVLDGAAWRAMLPEDRSAVLPRLEVLARATPADKVLLVQCLVEMGEIVIATGDSTEDGVVLKAAQVGAAMGGGATAVARDAAKVIIQDGSLATLARAVLWGRSIIESIRRFLVFQVTINIAVVLLTLIIAVQHMGVDRPFPLEAIQLLWLNLIMDSFGALMLATEQPQEELLYMLPQDKALPLFSRSMIKSILVHSAFQLGLCLFLTLADAGGAIFSIAPAAMGTRAHLTNVFNVFVWLNLFNFFNARRLHDQWSLLPGLRQALSFGLPLLGGIALLQVLFVEVGGDAMRTTALTAPQFLIGVALGALSLPVGVIVRQIPFRDNVFLASSGGNVGPGVSSWGLTLKRGGTGFWGGGGATLASSRIAPAPGGGTPYKPWTAADVPEDERTRLTAGGAQGPLSPGTGSFALGDTGSGRMADSISLSVTGGPSPRGGLGGSTSLSPSMRGGGVSVSPASARPPAMNAWASPAAEGLGLGLSYSSPSRAAGAQ